MTILAVLTEPETAGACLAAAGVAAAVDPGSLIEALHVRLKPESFLLPSEEVMTEARRRELERMLAERSRRLRMTFEEWSRTLGLVGRHAAWNEVVGEAVAREVAERGKSADLLVLARPHGGEGHEALRAAIFDTGRLFLLVPPSRAPRAFGQHIAIAWRESSQAQRAVAAAMPWLKAARRVTVLVVNDELGEGPRTVLATLTDHGIEPKVTVLERGDVSVGQQLLSAAHDTGADCLVMGAYRHSQMIEWILGGVTRHVLHVADLPVFMMH